MRYTAVAALVLGVMALENYAHRVAAWDDAGFVWSATAGLAEAALVALVASAYRATSVLVVSALAGVWALQIFACNAAWLVLRWEIKPNTPSCTDSLWPMLTTAGLIAAALCAQYLAQLIRRGRHG